MILGDHYAQHRHPASGEPLKGEVIWTPWDYALANALQLIEDFSDQNGLIVWEKESKDVIVEAVRKQDPFESAKDRITSAKKYDRLPGEYYVPRLSLKPWAKEWPTFQGWVEEQNKE